MTPAGDAIYVINEGSATISKVDLNSFGVVAEKGISIPGGSAQSNPLYLAVGRSNLVYFTDGACEASITTFDYANGTNVAVYNDGNGAGGITVTRDGSFLYRWRQDLCDWGDPTCWVTRYDALTNANLTPLESSFASGRRDPAGTPIFLDAAERWVFNKQQMFAATNVSGLLNQFSDCIYAVSLDGSLAFGPTEIFNTQTSAIITNFPFSSTIQTLSGDQQRLFRWSYGVTGTNLMIFDMASTASVSRAVVDWGSYYNEVAFFPAATPAGLTNAVAIAAGSDHDLALFGSGPPLPELRPRDIGWSGGLFNCSVPTQSGRVYRLEYKNSLADAAWRPLPLAAGNGRVQVLRDAMAAGAQRFYRIRRW